ncbi:MAG: xanthine dehydrogenase family protein subunit M [Dehalococcoidia bacterium]|nr:xanthine dehydrogenase family protein subunit M [Dehalococcoidia bacterium]
MNPFEYREPSSMEDVVGLLTAYEDAQVMAGGIDLLGEIKEGVASPGLLLGLAGIPGLTEISEGPTELVIGGMATITAIEQHPAIRRLYPALAEAAERLATPQVRNAGTLAGNLCQRPRCWYYRNPLTPCLKRGGDTCYVLEGYSKYMCVTGGSGCYAVNPSDAAVPLVAYGAGINIAGPAEDRSMPLEEFFTGPEVDITRENALERGEVVESVGLPEPPPGTRSIFLKAQERVAGGFALTSVATVVTINGDAIEAASIVLGGVAPTPLRARESEAYLLGKGVRDVSPEQAAALVLPDAQPFDDNRYKVTLARNLVTRSLTRVLQP